MILNKKVVEGSIVAGMLVVMTTTTSVTGFVVPGFNTNAVPNTIVMAEGQTHNVSAGVIEQLGNAEETVTAKLAVSVEPTDAQVVGAANEATMTAGAGVVDAVAQMTETETTVSDEAADASAQQAAEQATTAEPVDAAEPETAAPTQPDDTSTSEVQTPEDMAAEEAADAAAAQDAADAQNSVVSSETALIENQANTIQSDEVAAKLAEVQNEWENRLMPSVNEYLNIRTAGDDNAEVAGKLYKGDAAQIVEVGDTWTHITSGSVDGYVLNDYCAFGLDAYTLAQQDCQTEATVMTGGLRLRSEPSEDATVIDAVYEGQLLTVNTAVPSTDGWIAVEYDEQTAYVSAAYVNVDISVGDAISTQEEAAAKAAEAAKSSPAATTQNAAVAASTDEVTLLGALIQLEAGSECYEGKVAVGAVVMNRVRSGGYPSSISGVVYQGGQFTTAGSVAGVISNGVSGSCLQAAQEAINGADNTGGCVSFRRASSGRAGVVIGNHVFF